MADTRQRRTAVLTAALALTLCGCGGTPSGTTRKAHDAVRAAAEKLPADYTYVLTSNCGERLLLGTWKIVVHAPGGVASASAVGPDSNPNVSPSDLPTIEQLLSRVGDAAPDAEITFTTDPAGLPEHLTIDPIPQAIDDEECYDFADIRPL